MDNIGECGPVNVILKSSCDTVKIQDDLMDKRDLLLGDFDCHIEENLREKVSCIFTNSMRHTYIKER